MPLHFGIVFHKRELARERPRVLPLNVEGSGACRGEQLDEERGSLFGAGHLFLFLVLEREGRRGEGRKKKKSCRRDRSQRRATRNSSLELFLSRARECRVLFSAVR